MDKAAETSRDQRGRFSSALSNSFRQSRIVAATYGQGMSAEMVTARSKLLARPCGRIAPLGRWRAVLFRTASRFYTAAMFDPA
jgi:hypothetical protein